MAIDGFELKNQKILKRWLNELIQKTYQKTVGEICYIFTDDQNLLGINQNFLNHSTYTDIITFNSSIDSNVISGEIYISVERVKENAILHQQELNLEMTRVIVHGVLHLIGFDDQTAEEKARMKTQEDYCLNLLP